MQLGFSRLCISVRCGLVYGAVHFTAVRGEASCPDVAFLLSRQELYLNTCTLEHLNCQGMTARCGTVVFSGCSPRDGDRAAIAMCDDVTQQKIIGPSDPPTPACHSCMHVYIPLFHAAHNSSDELRPNSTSIDDVESLHLLAPFEPHLSPGDPQRRWPLTRDSMIPVLRVLASRRA